MPHFKAFLKLILQRRVVILLYAGIFLLAAVIVSKSVSLPDTNFTETELSIDVIDLDNSKAGKALTDYLSDRHDVRIIDYDKDKILREIFYGQNYYAVQIDKGFEEKLKSGQTDGLLTEYCVDGSYNAGFAQSQINKFIRCTAAYIAGGQTLENALSETSQTLSLETEVDVVSSGTGDEEGLSMPTVLFYTILAYILLAVVISGLTPALMVFRSDDISARVNISSFSPLRQLIQVIMGTAVYIAAIFALFFAAGCLLFGSGLEAVHIVYFSVNCLVYMIVAVSISMLISLLIKNPKLCDMIVNTLGLGMSFLCGVFVPQSILGDGVNTAAHLLPAYWYVRAVNELSVPVSEIDKGEVMLDIAVELVFAAVLFAVSFIISKKRASVGK